MAAAQPGPPGAIVVLSLAAPVVPEAPSPSAPGEAIDLDGAVAQLLERGADGRWRVVTLDGHTLLVPPSSVSLAASEDLEALGVDAVLGPATRLPAVAEHVSELLAERGFAVASVPIAQALRADALEAVARLDAEGLLQRLPSAFESGYLGCGARRSAKVALLESLLEELPPELLSAALPAQDRLLTELCASLAPHLQEAAGLGIQSRTNLMLRLPVAEEDAARLPHPEPEAREVDDFLALMGRRRGLALQCWGPGALRLRLVPRSPGLAETSLSLAPGFLALVLTDWYDYECELDPGSLAVQSFFLDRPMEFVFSPPGGIQLAPEDLPLPTGPGLPAGEPICVTGMASRDPCYVDDHETLWTALRHAGCDGFLEIPHTRFDVDAYVDYTDQAAAVQRGKSYCRHQGHLEGIELFDASFFGIPQQEAYGMDPEQRIVLETGWLALSEAGFQRKTVQKEGAHLGVFVGISSSDWRDVCQAPSANGVPETFIANRFSYVINLKGPSFISNTACSASLVAMHSAKVHLLFPTDPLHGAVVAGVSLNTSPGTWIGNCAGNMLSFLGRSFSFNSSADGYGRGEGCAAAVVRRCEYDPTDSGTLALLAGSNTNSDGRSASLTAPNGPAQQRLLRAILAETELETAEVCVYEAHGTGTSLGDPIEIGAVKKVLAQRSYPLLVSCSKTNLGHLEGGAGMSSFCKCVMACMHAECAPNQHLNALNPHMDLAGWPAQLLSEGLALQGDTAFVGVSGFGYGGTNSHAMAYGRNVITSRGAANPAHVERSLFQKLRAAPAPEICVQGDSYEEWVSSGVPHLAREADVSFSVEVLEGGGVVWREVPKASLADVVDFQIQGSFTGWEPVGLQACGSEEGVWWFEFDLGASGEELFQIVVDHDPSLLLYPQQPRCPRAAAPVLGPAAAPSRDHAWLVRGEAGARHRVEFFRSPTATGVFWRPCGAEPAREGQAVLDHDYIQE